jgi:septal ring factor EnvC (AmiA/AmiB activator)
VQLDRQSIERNDFPLVRRGYDPAAVSAHLQALAAAAQELSQRAANAGAEPSLGTAAATRVQGILEAAQTTAAEIEREAQRDAQSTREQAAGELERARTHVETLARAAAALLVQVQSLDGEVSTLARSLRAEGASQGEASHWDISTEDTTQPAPAAEEERERSPASVAAAEELPAAEEAPEVVPQRAEDLDGARLVALNMALSGEPREQTDRYLADSFQLSNRAKLLDEVYAAVEG